MRTIIVLLLLALPSTASAASVEVLRSTGTHFSGLALAGDSVVVGSYPPNHTVDLLTATPGRPAQRAMHVGSNSSLVAGASGNTILARRSDEGGATEVYSGPLTGPLNKVEGCPQNPDFAFPAAPVIDADLMAWSAAGCVRDRIHMQLGSIVRTVDATGLVERLAAAGRYVAWIANESHAVRLTVYDVQIGQTAYTLPIDGTGQLDVQADGTVAVTQLDLTGNRAPCHGSPPERIAYFTVAEPVAHIVPVSTCFSAVKIAANRIAFADHLPDGANVLALTNLTGTQVQPVAGIDAEPSTFPDFDYDGAHIAWTQVRCRDEVVLRQDATDTSQNASVTCPVHVGRPILRRDGTLHVAVSCPNGCRPVPGATQQGMHIVSPRWLHVRSKDRHGNAVYSPFVPFNLQAGKRTVVRLPLTSHQRALLRRRHSVSVRLKVLLQNVYLPRLVRTAHG